MVPIVKIGKGEDMKEYRGITLMPSLYKVYTSALGERLRSKTEELGLIPHNQTGSGKGTVNTIFILNFMINR